MTLLFVLVLCVCPFVLLFVCWILVFALCYSGYVAVSIYFVVCLVCWVLSFCCFYMMDCVVCCWFGFLILVITCLFCFVDCLAAGLRWLCLIVDDSTLSLFASYYYVNFDALSRLACLALFVWVVSWCCLFGGFAGLLWIFDWLLPFACIRVFDFGVWLFWLFVDFVDFRLVIGACCCFVWLIDLMSLRFLRILVGFIRD